MLHVYSVQAAHDLGWHRRMRPTSWCLYNSMHARSCTQNAEMPAQAGTCTSAAAEEPQEAAAQLRAVSNAWGKLMARASLALSAGQGPHGPGTLMSPRSISWPVSQYLPCACTVCLSAAGCTTAGTRAPAAFSALWQPVSQAAAASFCPTLQSIEPSWYKPWPEAGFVSSARLLPAAEPSLLDLKSCSVCHPGSSPAQGTLRPCWRGWMLGGWTWAAAVTHAADLLILLLRVSRGCQGLWCQHVLNRQWGGHQGLHCTHHACRSAALERRLQVVWHAAGTRTTTDDWISLHASHAPSFLIICAVCTRPMLCARTLVGHRWSLRTAPEPLEF